MDQLTQFVDELALVGFPEDYDLYQASREQLLVAIRRGSIRQPDPFEQGVGTSLLTPEVVTAALTAIAAASKIVSTLLMKKEDAAKVRARARKQFAESLVEAGVKPDAAASLADKYADGLAR